MSKKDAERIRTRAGSAFQKTVDAFMQPLANAGPRDCRTARLLMAHALVGSRQGFWKSPEQWKKAASKERGFKRCFIGDDNVRVVDWAVVMAMIMEMMAQMMEDKEDA